MGRRRSSSRGAAGCGSRNRSSASLGDPAAVAVERRGRDARAHGRGRDEHRPSSERPPPIARPRRRCGASSGGATKRFAAAAGGRRCLAVSMPIPRRRASRRWSGGRGAARRRCCISWPGSSDRAPGTWRSLGEPLGGRSTGGARRARGAAHVALVTQEPGLVPYLSALENVELGLQLRGAGGATRRRRAPAVRSSRSVSRSGSARRRPALGGRAAARCDRPRAGRRRPAAARRRADRASGRGERPLRRRVCSRAPHTSTASPSSARRTTRS